MGALEAGLRSRGGRGPHAAGSSQGALLGESAGVVAEHGGRGGAAAILEREGELGLWRRNTQPARP